MNSSYDRLFQCALLQALTEAATQPEPIAADLTLLYPPLCQIWMTNTTLDTSLTYTVMTYQNSSPHITNVPIGQEQVTAARLWLREYLALTTYDNAIRMAVCRELEALRVRDPKATAWKQTVWLRQAMESHQPALVRTLLALGAAQGWHQPDDLLRLYQYVEKQRQGALGGGPPLGPS